MILSCKKDEEKSGEVICQPDTDFTSISVANEFAEYISRDTSDCSYDDDWCDEIRSLFRPDTLDLSNTQTDSIGIVNFPNPVLYRQYLGIYSHNNKCFMQIAVVDESMHIKDKGCFQVDSGFHVFQYQLLADTTLQYETGKYYRLYYAAHATGGLFFYKGHADIYIQ